MILAHRQGLTLLACCEDADLCQDFAVNEGRISRRLRIPGRPAIAEELQVMLAEETGAAIHICHVSTAKAVAIIRRYKRKGVRVTCGTCPQYFTFTEDEVLTQGATARVCPPLRTAADVEGIIEGLKDGTIDVIASGHVPLPGRNCAALGQSPRGDGKPRDRLCRHPYRTLPHRGNAPQRHSAENDHKSRLDPPSAQHGPSGGG